MNGMDNIGVTVICLVYNHERYIRKCLENFVNQKTSFRFEVIVHDDCSADKSKEIIEDFHCNYPDIIKPIYEEENQFSKGLSFITKMIKGAKGKYVAFCEGDDYWCDENKLQKQYDFMNDHEECSMCVHNSYMFNLSENRMNGVFFDESKISGEILTEEQIFDSWMVHASSYFCRNNYDIYPEWALDYFSGDYVILTVAYANGKVGLINEKMSVYNLFNEGGATINNVKNERVRIKRVRDRRDYLLLFLKNFIVDKSAGQVINNRIKAIDEHTAASELIVDMADKATASLSDDEKLLWLVGRLNSEEIRDHCMCPSKGTENAFSHDLTHDLFNVVNEFLLTLQSLKAFLPFSLPAWLVEWFFLGIKSKDLLYAIAAHEDNTVGWGGNLSGSGSQRKEALIKHFESAISTGNTAERLLTEKEKAVNAFEREDYTLSLEMINEELTVFPLDKDLIAYKSLVLDRLGRSNEALNEIGIYCYFYGMDEYVEPLYKDILARGE